MLAAPARSPSPNVVWGIALAACAATAVATALALAAYFVASESLTNVTKYARATAAAVRVSGAAGAVTIEIADDGVGGADDGLGTGLRGLADRVEALDGHLRVSSPAGAGTTVTAELPLPEKGFAAR